MKEDYPFFAELLKYPGAGLRASLANCGNKTLSPLVDFVSGASDADWEELYIRTFDIHAICYLEVGYVLFGEDYKRGHFLVKMQGLQIEHQNDCGTELSDHLVNVLTLLPKMKDQEEARDMVARLVAPAMKKMLQGFSKGGNVYQSALQAILETLQKDYECFDGVVEGAEGPDGPEGKEKPGVALRRYDDSLELPAYNPNTNPWDIWREP